LNSFLIFMTNKRSLSLDVIIVTKQRYSQLLECATRICNNTQKPANLIIVDSSSKRDEKILLTISKLCKLKKIKLTMIEASDHGIAYSRNLGIRSVKSTHFAFVDDDEYVTKYWCRKILIFFENNQDYQVLCGPKIPTNLDNYLNQTWASIFLPSLSYSGVANFVPSGNSCYQTRFIRENQLFYDERFSSSAEAHAMYSNLIHHGAQCFFLANLCILHDWNTSLTTFTKRWFEYGRGIHFFFHEYLASEFSGSLQRYLFLAPDHLFRFFPFRNNRLVAQ